MVKRATSYITAETLDAKATAWLDDIRSEVAPRPRLRLDPGRCALVVVDMLRYFASESGAAYLPAARVILPNILSLIEAWRGVGATVLYTRHCHREKRENGMLGRFFSEVIDCESADSQLIEELHPLERERVFRKYTYDSFHNTGLEPWLRSEGCDQLLICGVLTQLCCETTARSAFVRGYEVYCPVDAMASSRERLHTGSLLSMASGVAVAMSTEEILERCAASG